MLEETEVRNLGSVGPGDPLHAMFYFDKVHCDHMYLRVPELGVLGRNGAERRYHWCLIPRAGLAQQGNRLL